MNEKSDGLKKFDHFEAWTPGQDGRAGHSSAQGRHYRSLGSSVAENVMVNGGLKVGGLVKKVCHSIYHIVTATV
jgi:hypothetical protein